MSREDYLYATGVVRSLESRVLNPNDVERMVDAPDLAAAFKVFNDTDYFDNVQDLEPSQFLQALDEDLQQVRQRIMEVAPDKKVVHFLLMRNDFRNMKLLYKAYFAQKEVDEHINKTGNEDPEKLALAIEGEKVSILPYCQRAIDYVRQRVEDESKGATPALIDRWFDRKYFKEYQDQAKRLKSKFIEDLVQLQLEIANLKTFIRGKILELPEEYIVSETLYAQEIPEDKGSTLEIVTAAAKLSLEGGLDLLSSYLSRGVQEVLHKYIKDSLPLEQLEKNLENVENDFIRQTKYIDNGPELIVAYYYAKRDGIRNTRIIMTGKANKIPAPEIKKLIRTFY